MLKKAVLVAVMSAALAAFAAPSVALADTFRYASGSHAQVEPGAAVDLLGEVFIDNLWYDGSCGVEYHGEVIENGGGAAELEESEPTTTLGCTFGGGKTSFEFGNLRFQGDEAGGQRYGTGSPVVVVFEGYPSQPGTFYYSYEYGETSFSLPFEWNNGLYFPGLGASMWFSGSFSMKGASPEAGTPVEIAEE